MSFLKNECWSWNLLMIPAMAILVAAMYFIGYLGYVNYNWTGEVDKPRLILLTALIAFAYLYLVIKADVIAFMVLMIQFVALILMVILQGIYGLWFVEVFTLSKKVFENLNAALIMIQGATVLPVLIRGRTSE